MLLEIISIITGSVTSITSTYALIARMMREWIGEFMNSRETGTPLWQPYWIRLRSVLTFYPAVSHELSCSNNRQIRTDRHMVTPNGNEEHDGGANQLVKDWSGEILEVCCCGVFWPRDYIHNIVLAHFLLKKNRFKKTKFMLEIDRLQIEI